MIQKPCGQSFPLDSVSIHFFFFPFYKLLLRDRGCDDRLIRYSFQLVPRHLAIVLLDYSFF